VHEVLRVIEERARTGSRPGERSDGLRVALAIEGGGMRGTVSAGMALAMHERGLVSALDAVYGSSAGAITGAWLLSSEPERLRGWAHPDYARTMIRWSALLRRQPVADVRTLVEVVYQTEWPMDFRSILASPIEFHPLATDAATGVSTDLRPMIANPAELRLALRASAALPFLAGPPVRLRAHRYYDAGLAETIPFRTPLAQGATHILVLRSRRPPDVIDAPAAIGAETGQPSPPRSVQFLTRTALRNESPELRTALLTRSARTAADVAAIAEREAAGAACTVFPPASTPPVSRLTTDAVLLAAALESGREAVNAVFTGDRGPGTTGAGRLLIQVTAACDGATIRGNGECLEDNDDCQWRARADRLRCRDGGARPGGAARAAARRGAVHRANRCHRGRVPRAAA
jgi:predicted patatin/cPLA2 family phospholipase